MAAVTSVGKKLCCVRDHGTTAALTPNKTIAYPHKENLIANAACGRPLSQRNTSNPNAKTYAQSRYTNTNDCRCDRETLLQRRKLEPLSPIIFNFDETNNAGRPGMVGKTYIESEPWNKMMPVASNNKQGNIVDETPTRSETPIGIKIRALKKLHRTTTAIAPKQHDDSAVDDSRANNKVVRNASVARSRQTLEKRAMVKEDTALEQTPSMRMQLLQLQRTSPKTYNLSDATPLSLRGAVNASTTRTTIPPTKQSTPPRQPTQSSESITLSSVCMTPLRQKLVSKYGTNPQAEMEKEDEFNTPIRCGLARSINGNKSKIDQHKQVAAARQSLIGMKEANKSMLIAAPPPPPPPPLRLRHVSNAMSCIYSMQPTVTKETLPEKNLVQNDDHKTEAARCGELSTEKTPPLSLPLLKVRSLTRAEAFELLKRKGRSVQSSVVVKSSKSETLGEQKTKLASTTKSTLTLLGRRDAAMQQMQQLRQQRAREFKNSIAYNGSNGVTRSGSLPDDLENVPSSELLCVTQSCSFKSPNSGVEKEKDSRVQMRRKKAREILAQRKQRQH